ncbi:MAG: polyhydroxybutyrate depolymerase [Gammaproteobacteria bacterium]|nr:polyhydroxybutyrate depolymerase [Gammaproteobacteria bacterium]
MKPTSAWPAFNGVRAWLIAMTCVALGACGSDAVDAPRGDRLAALPIADGTVTVSGIAAGGYMAVQFHVANSSLVSGAGIVAAGPYYCAENSLRYALGRCMQGDEPIAVDELVGLTSQLALDAHIDPIANLANDRVWIFRGGRDEVVSKNVVDALQAYYELLVDPRAVQRTELPAAGHTFPAAADNLQDCGETDTPFIGNCGLPGARVMLEHLYGKFVVGKGKPQRGTLVEYSQADYARATGAAGLAARGWLYVPAACGEKSGKADCRLHVAFHGCKQGASYVKDAFVRQAGYLEAADAGGIVVLFPQVEPSFQPLNPNGCWDWWGYTGDAYATQAGPQMAAVKAMIEDLLGEGAGAATPK